MPAVGKPALARSCRVEGPAVVTRRKAGRSVGAYTNSVGSPTRGTVGTPVVWNETVLPSARSTYTPTPGSSTANEKPPSERPTNGYARAVVVLSCTP